MIDEVLGVELKVHFLLCGTCSSRFEDEKHPGARKTRESVCVS